MQRPEIKIRFASKSQKEKVVRAAKLRRWSLTTFISEAASKMADETLETSKMLENPLTADGKMPALNQ